MQSVVIGISCDSSAEFPTVNQIQQPWDSSGWNQSEFPRSLHQKSRLTGGKVSAEMTSFLFLTDWSVTLTDGLKQALYKTKCLENLH